MPFSTSMGVKIVEFAYFHGFHPFLPPTGLGKGVQLSSPYFRKQLQPVKFTEIPLKIEHLRDRKVVIQNNLELSGGRRVHEECSQLPVELDLRNIRPSGQKSVYCGIFFWFRGSSGGVSQDNFFTGVSPLINFFTGGIPADNFFHRGGSQRGT